MTEKPKFLGRGIEYFSGEKPEAENLRFHRFLEDMGLAQDENHLHFTSMAYLESAIQAKKDLTEEEKARLIELCANKMLRIAKLALEKDSNPFIAMGYLRALGRSDLIQKRLSKGLEIKEGEPDLDLVLAALDYGTESQAEKGVDGWIKNRGSLSPLMEKTVYFSKRMKPIAESYAIFTEATGLPKAMLATNAIPGGSRIEAVNAAIELRKMGYDLVIGVHKAGTPLAALMDFFGQNTRYAEWHHSWKGEPRWKNIGSHTDRPKPADKILLSEHDTHTGTTIKSFVPFLKKLKPSVVDIAYCVDFHGTNERMTSEAGFYNKQTLVWDITRENILENLNQAAHEAESKLARQQKK